MNFDVHVISVNPRIWTFHHSKKKRSQSIGIRYRDPAESLQSPKRQIRHTIQSQPDPTRWIRQIKMRRSKRRSGFQCKRQFHQSKDRKKIHYTNRWSLNEYRIGTNTLHGNLHHGDKTYLRTARKCISITTK